MLHVSKTKIAQIEAVNNNLIPEWKEELKGERLTFSAAYELSGMTADEQREALGKFTETQYIEITEQIRATPLMEDVPVYEMRENPDTGEKERVQVGTRQVVSGERERLMIIQDRCMKQCRQGASDFGLTVSSRCRLVVPKPQQQKPENKFAKYAN